MLTKLLGELRRHPKVVGAYLFGSHGTIKETPLSDIDICVFTKDLGKKDLLKLKSFGSETVDISIFDNLPIYIKPEVFKGKPLFLKDKRYVWHRAAIAFREYFDFRKVEEAYWKQLKKRVKHEKGRSFRRP